MNPETPPSAAYRITTPRHLRPPSRRLRARALHFLRRHRRHTAVTGRIPA